MVSFEEAISFVRNNNGFRPNRNESSYYRIYKIDGIRKIQVRVSNHGTRLRTWLDKDYDPSASINICVVFSQNGNSNYDCQIERNLKRGFEVIQYVYNCELLDVDDVRSINANIQTIYKNKGFQDPLAGTPKAAERQTLKSCISESISHFKSPLAECKEWMMKLGCYSQHQLDVINEGKTILSEAISIEKAKSIFGFDDDTFNRLLNADPTYNPNKGTVGKFFTWIANCYKNNPDEGIPETLGDDLNFFNRNQNKNIGNLKNINSFAQLHDVVSSFNAEGNNTKSEKKKTAVEMGTNVVYDSPEWMIVVPTNYEASRYWGKDTCWCTAANSEEGVRKYNEYADDSKLYINIDKETGEKYQFYFPSSEFMNEYDEKIEMPMENMPQDVLDFYFREVGSEALHLKYAYVSKFYDGFALVELNGKCSYINTNGELIGNGNLWFDRAGYFFDGLAKVKRNGKYSFINTNFELIGNGDIWFDDADNFHNGFARVEIDGKHSFINTNGELIGNGNAWFNFAESFKNGFAQVGLNGKCSFINTNGEFIGNDKMRFDYVGDFSEGFASVKIGNKWSFISKNVEFIGNGNMWFDRVYDFYNGFAIVEIDGKYSFINTDGELIGDGKMWFDYVYDFRNDFAKVVLNETYYYLDTKGNLYSYNNRTPVDYNQIVNGRNSNESIYRRRMADVITESIIRRLRR